MSYRAADQTGEDAESRGPGEIQVIRKLTASQGARSELYELGDETGRIRSETVVRKRGGSRRSVPLEHQETADLAAREHLQRLLRQARDAANEVWIGDDPRDIALSGAKLNALLRDLWVLRRAREGDDWGAAINLLQIVLAQVDFEALDRDRRRALFLLFEEDLFARTVGRPEMERLMRVLSNAGFDIWRGLEDTEVGETDDG